jgi:transcriptional regulator with XRE-family HTH domain
MREIGLRLRVLRSRRGLSQRQLGVLAGVSQYTVLRIENGHNAPTLPTLTSLARALEMTVGELLGET